MSKATPHIEVSPTPPYNRCCCGESRGSSGMDCIMTGCSTCCCISKSSVMCCPICMNNQAATLDIAIVLFSQIGKGPESMKIGSLGCSLSIQENNLDDPFSGLNELRPHF